MTKKDKELITGFLEDRLSREEKALLLKKASNDKDFIRELLREIELDGLIEQQYGLGELDD